MAKSASTTNPPIPCGNFVGLSNSNMIKVGSSYKSASEYDMNYSWLIRLHVEQADDFAENLSYNVYRQDELIASDLKSMTYADEDVSEGDVCYNIEAIYNNTSILSSEDICLTVIPAEPEIDKSPKLYPNPTSDYVKICDDNIRNVKIYSVMGSLLFEENTNSYELEIDMRRFGNGLYLMQIATETETKVYKVLKF